MPYKDKPVEKLYYSISEVAEMFDVSQSLIRFWETEFPILQPRKNKKGNRLFSKTDIDNFRAIHHLVKEKGLTLEGARKALKANPAKTMDNVGISSQLKDIRQFLDELLKSL
jgi:DNA-binding transcriptional MerR regulator